MMDITKILENEELKKQLLEAKSEAENSGKTMEEYAKIALPIIRAAGYDVTEQEILDTLIMQNSSLDEKDLDKIAGGGLCCQFTYCRHSKCHPNC